MTDFGVITSFRPFISAEVNYIHGEPHFRKQIRFQFYSSTVISCKYNFLAYFRKCNLRPKYEIDKIEKSYPRQTTGMGFVNKISPRCIRSSADDDSRRNDRKGFFFPFLIISKDTSIVCLFCEACNLHSQHSDEIGFFLRFLFIQRSKAVCEIVFLGGRGLSNEAGKETNLPHFYCIHI